MSSQAFRALEPSGSVEQHGLLRRSTTTPRPEVCSGRTSVVKKEKEMIKKNKRNGNFAVSLNISHLPGSYLRPPSILPSHADTQTPPGPAPNPSLRSFWEWLLAGLLLEGLRLELGGGGGGVGVVGGVGGSETFQTAGASASPGQTRMTAGSR